jgi:hypothetical protein
MLLPRDQALSFIDGYKAVLLHILSTSGKARSDSLIDDLATARTLAKEQPGLLSDALAQLSAHGQGVDQAVTEAIQTLRVAQWVYLRHTKTAAIFIDSEVKNAFAVRALTTPLNEVVESPPSTFEAGVFEYVGHYVCDGIVANPVFLGPGYRAQFNAAYTSIRKAGRFHAKPAV